MKLVDYHIRELEELFQNQMASGVLTDAIEELKGKHSIHKYFEKYVTLTTENLREDCIEGLENELSEQINEGETTLEKVAQTLTYSKFKELLENYCESPKNKHIYLAWDKAMPELGLKQTAKRIREQKRKRNYN